MKLKIQWLWQTEDVFITCRLQQQSVYAIADASQSFGLTGNYVAGHALRTRG
ncbi:hypothetical protein [Paenibacillus taiwanensis]|uniref:hypothetical protein n=1 Tax=Paenibacillus taiwanensis TaxID=401638 RepID=UPI0004199328|nr:hypothetical protein [Paenibacillus taiwanensis]